MQYLLCVISTELYRDENQPTNKSISQSINQPTNQGRSDGGYIGIYTPKSVYLTNFLCGYCMVVFFSLMGGHPILHCGTLTCFDFEIGMTS